MKRRREALEEPLNTNRPFYWISYFDIAGYATAHKM